MTYLVLSDDATAAKLEKLIEKAFPDEDKYLKIGAQQWLVNDEASTGKTVWDKIVGDDYPDPPISVIIPFNNYYGVHYTHVWDWKNAKAD